MRKKKKYFSLLLSLSVLFVALAGIGVSYAYTKHNVQHDNRLTAHTVSAVIEEETDGDLKIEKGGFEQKKVTIRNTGSAPVFVRMACVGSWYNGTEWLPYAGEYTTIEWALGENWVYNPLDGYYYYKFVLPSGAAPASETCIVDSRVLFANDIPDKYLTGKYNLAFTLEVAQCSTDEDVNASALGTLFGVTAAFNGSSLVVDEDSMVTNAKVTWSFE